MDVSHALCHRSNACRGANKMLNSATSMVAVVYAALVCEKFGLLDKALEYTAACWGPEKYGGGDLFSLFKSLSHSSKGRVCARQGKTADARR